jgi:hypothetical protein
MWRGHRFGSGAAIERARELRLDVLLLELFTAVYALYRARADSLEVNGELLGDFSLAACVRAEALKVGRFLHGLALNAAIFAAVGRFTTAGGILAFPLFCCHKSSYLSSS